MPTTTADGGFFSWLASEGVVNERELIKKSSVKNQDMLEPLLPLSNSNILDSENELI
ncbi:hypothetical protein GCM10023197_05320 [Gordonia humi]